MLVPRGELFVGVLGPMSVRDWETGSPFPAILHGSEQFPHLPIRGNWYMNVFPVIFPWNRRVLLLFRVQTRLLKNNYDWLIRL